MLATGALQAEDHADQVAVPREAGADGEARQHRGRAGGERTPPRFRDPSLCPWAAPPRARTLHGSSALRFSRLLPCRPPSSSAVLSQLSAASCYRPAARAPRPACPRTSRDSCTGSISCCGAGCSRLNASSTAHRVSASRCLTSRRPMRPSRSTHTNTHPHTHPPTHTHTHTHAHPRPPTAHPGPAFLCRLWSRPPTPGRWAGRRPDTLPTRVDGNALPVGPRGLGRNTCPCSPVQSGSRDGGGSGGGGACAVVADALSRPAMGVRHGGSGAVGERGCGEEEVARGEADLIAWLSGRGAVRKWCSKLFQRKECAPIM